MSARRLKWRSSRTQNTKIFVRKVAPKREQRLHHLNTKGDNRNVHGHIFMKSRVLDEAGNFAKTKIRSLDDRKLGPIEVERIREMWETRCNRALRKAGFSESVTRNR